MKKISGMLSIVVITSILIVIGTMILIICLEKERDKKTVSLKQQAQELKTKSDKELILTILEIEYQNILTKVPEYHEEERFSGLLSSSHALAHSNKTLTVESRLILKGELENGRVISLAIIDEGNIQKESLKILLKKGSRISFPKGNIKACIIMNRHEVPLDAPILITYAETYFNNSTQLGTKCASRIKILK